MFDDGDAPEIDWAKLNAKLRNWADVRGKGEPITIDPKKVYIIFEDVPFELGQIHGVFATNAIATLQLKLMRKDYIKSYWNAGANFDAYYSIQEWEVEGWDTVNGK